MILSGSQAAAGNTQGVRQRHQQLCSCSPAPKPVNLLACCFFKPCNKLAPNASASCPSPIAAAKQTNARNKLAASAAVEAAAAAAEGPAAPTPESIFRGCSAYVGPVSAIHSPGKGMGLGASRSLSNPGDLLLISHPIAAVAAAGDLTAADQEAKTANPHGNKEVVEEEQKEEEEEGPAMFVPYYVWTGSSLDGATAEEGQGPWEADTPTDALSAYMQHRRYTTAEAQWLDALVGGASPASPPARGTSSSNDEGVPSSSSSSSNDEGVPSSSSRSGGVAARPMPAPGSSYISATGARDQPMPTLPSSSHPDLEQASQLSSFIERYAFQSHAEDMGIAEIQRRDAAEQVAGIWPEQALLNHSCVPSTISYVSRGAMVTRLTRRSIKAGSELFTNYLGDEVMAPFLVRQDALRSNYGFVCECARCKEEGRVDKQLMQLICDIYESCSEQVQEDLEEAISKGDDDALQSIKAQLSAFVEVVDAAFTKSGVSERTQIWLQAGLMQLYESLFVVAAALGERDLRLSELLQALVGAIQPGSELHLFWARTHLQSTKDEAAEAAAAQEAVMAAAQEAVEGPPGMKQKRRRGGRGGAPKVPAASSAGMGFGAVGGGTDDRDAIVHADKLCYRAYQARYGPISRRLYLTLLSKAAGGV